MPRKYDLALLDSLKNNQKIINYEGIDILVKPIPEGGEDGDMDPRVYKQMRMMPFVMKFIPKKKKEQSEKKSQKMVMRLRKMFNTYKGDYIADAGITTHHMEVDSTDNYKVPIRIYKRENAGKDLPMFVYYHGGGFFGGGPDIVEQMCKTLVSNLDCVAFNIDYRLCPENHYPQPLDDCFLATKWIHENAEKFDGNKNKLVVSGDSAGGNLAGAVTLRDLDEKTNMVASQVLIYPATMVSNQHTVYFKGTDVSKYHMSEKHRKVIMAMSNGLGSLMNADDNMLHKVYLQGNISPEHPYVSPALGEAKALPPTMLIFGEHDFLVFDNFAYAKKLTDNDVKLKTVVYRGMGHGFADQIGVAPQAEDCMKEIAIYMKELFS